MLFLLKCQFGSSAHITSTFLGNLLRTFGKIAFVSENSLTDFGFCKKRLRAELGIFNLFLIELSKKKGWKPHPLTSPSCITTFLHFMVGVTRENSKQNYGSFTFLCVPRL